MTDLPCPHCAASFPVPVDDFLDSVECPHCGKVCEVVHECSEMDDGDTWCWDSHR